MAESFIVVKKCGTVRQAEPSQAGVRILLRQARRSAKQEEVTEVLNWMQQAKPGDSLQFDKVAVLVATTPDSQHGELIEKKTVAYDYIVRDAPPELEEEITHPITKPIDDNDDGDEDEDDEEENDDDFFMEDHDETDEDDDDDD